MKETRIITTKQKKFLDKTLKILGIDTDELLQINNLSEIIEKQNAQEKKISELQEQLQLQVKINSEITKQLQEANGSIEVLNMKLQETMFEKIWDGGVSDNA